MSELVSRQHKETDVNEIVGKVCKNLLAVGGIDVDSIIIFYLSLETLWLRIFLDAGVLFIDVCEKPDPEDDLGEGEDYLDLATMHSLINEKITKASMKEGVFRLGFECGTELFFEQCDDQTKLSVVKR